MHYNAAMTATRVIIVVLAVVLVAAAIWAYAKKQAPPAVPQPSTQAAAPSASQDTQAVSTPAATGWSGDATNFTYTSADGNTYTADQRFAGKPLVVNFWAAW